MQSRVVSDQRHRRQVALAWAARRSLDDQALALLRLGIGTGSTVQRFIDVLGQAPLPGAVRYFSTSLATTAALERIGLSVCSTAEEAQLDLYIDSADQVNGAFEMIKGGGAALTQEKILATMAREMWCLVDYPKCVINLADYPIPIELLASAAASVGYRCAEQGWQLRRQEGRLSDQGNPVFYLEKGTIKDACAQEIEWSAMPGVVSVGLFARRRADQLYVALGTGRVSIYKL